MTLNDVKNNPFLLDRLDHTGRQTYYKDGYKGQNVIVCVLDTGVNNHTELTGKLLTGNSGAIDGDYDIYHGTACASLIAGTNVGVAPSVKIVPFRRVGTSPQTIVDGLKFAREWRGANGEKVNIISLSSHSTSNYAGLYAEIQACYAANISVVCSSGNTGVNDITYPGAFQETITVGSVNNKMEYSTFESFGQMLDVVQYGEYIIVANGLLPTDYKSMEGTSFSTPIVSGILALYYSKYFDLFKEYPTPKEAKRFLLMHSIDLGLPKEDNYYGVGFATLDVHIPKRVELQIGSDQMKVNGYSQTIPQTPIISASGSTLVPLRAPMEASGFKVEWINEGQKIILTN